MGYKWDIPHFQTHTLYTPFVFVFGHPIFMGVPAFAISKSGFSWSTCGSSGGQFCSQLLLQSAVLFYPHNVSGLKITAVPIHSILKLKTTQVV
jgi:hypothetical protein